MVRISATQLTRHRDCPRSWWYEQGEHKSDISSSPAVGFGSLFHAFAEFYGLKRRLPTWREFGEMDGTYDTPGEVRAKHPGLYQPAMDTFIWVLNHHPDLFVFPENAEFEKPISDWGLSIGGEEALGVIDVYMPQEDPAHVVIRDYKTRASLSYAPRTGADFRADIQQTYYAAAVAAANPHVERVHVQHVNVLRPDKGGPQVLVAGTTLDRWFLEAVWADIAGEQIPNMIALAGETDAREVPRNRQHCFKYGKCPHFSYCQAHKSEVTDIHALIGWAVTKDTP